MADKDQVTSKDAFLAKAILGAGGIDTLKIKGYFEVECYDADGNLRWADDIHNTVVTVGKNYLLDTVLAGSGYSVTGPYMGLISSVGYSAIAAGDTMSSHAGWTEAGLANAPTYSGNRKTCVFAAAAAGSKALSAALSFSITGTGTVKGGFIVLGSGAVNTKDDTNGTLFAAGLFTNGDRSVFNGDTITGNYSITLT